MDTHIRTLCLVMMIAHVYFAYCAHGGDIFDAAEKGNVEEITRILTENPTAVRQLRVKTTPLHIAARYGHVSIIRLLLNHGAHVNAMDAYGDTPLHHGIRSKQPEVVSVLLEHGAEIEARGFCGRSPLSNAVIDTIRFLIDLGADVGHGCREIGLTPLHKAAECDHDITVALVQHGADVNALAWYDNSQYVTPLQWAILHAYFDFSIVRFLIQHGAKIRDGEDDLLERKIRKKRPDYDWRADKAQFIQARIACLMNQLGVPEVIAKLILEIEGVVPSPTSEATDNGSECAA